MHSGWENGENQRERARRVRVDGEVDGMTATTVEGLLPRMKQICGAANVITDPLELRT